MGICLTVLTAVQHHTMAWHAAETRTVAMGPVIKGDALTLT
jgi:hypothetical protein